MAEPVRFNRRSFVIAVAGLPLITLATAPASQHYVCPPCGCASDGRVFESPGLCPSCSMTLIAQADGAFPYGRAQFPKGAASIQIPFELLANAIFIPVRVDGKGPYLFALDTGSTNSVIAREVSEELRIVAGARFHATGAGSDSSLASRVEKVEFGLPGPLVRSTTQAAVIAMSGLWPLIGRRFYGDIGYDVIQPFVVEIDYQRKILTLHDPERYRGFVGGVTLPFRLFGSYDPQIDGQIVVAGRPPIPVRFTIDTGAGGTIVSSPLVDSYHLLDVVQKTVATQDTGIGNAQPTEVAARLTAIRVGPYELRGPLVALSRDKMGSLSNAAISVNLGGNILRRFTVIIDYSRNRLTLKPNASFDAPFKYDASGLLLEANGDDFRTFVVKSVLMHSAASDAGIQPGDVILAVDGKSTERVALWQLQELLQASGSSVPVTIGREGKRREYVLALRALL